MKGLLSWFFRWELIAKLSKLSSSSVMILVQSSSGHDQQGTIFSYPLKVKLYNNVAPRVLLVLKHQGPPTDWGPLSYTAVFGLALAVLHQTQKGCPGVRRGSHHVTVLPLAVSDTDNPDRPGYHDALVVCEGALLERRPVKVGSHFLSSSPMNLILSDGDNDADTRSAKMPKVWTVSSGLV